MMSMSSSRWSFFSTPCSEYAILTCIQDSSCLYCFASWNTKSAGSDLLLLLQNLPLYEGYFVGWFAVSHFISFWLTECLNTSLLLNFQTYIFSSLKKNLLVDPKELVTWSVSSCHPIEEQICTDVTAIVSQRNTDRDLVLTELHQCTGST